MMARRPSTRIALERQRSLLTRSTTVEQHLGEHPETGLPIVQAVEVVTDYHEHAQDGGEVDLDWAAELVEELHDAEVALASLPAAQRAVATRRAQEACADLDLEDHPRAIWGAVRAARGPGRPAKSPSGAATETIRFRCTPAQRNRLRELADAEGLTLTAYLLARCLSIVVAVSALTS